MFAWCAILFGLGILAFLDSLFNMGEIFRRVNSVIFMLTALALLVRTTTKAREHKSEDYIDQIKSLKQDIRTLRSGKKKLADF